MNKWAPARVADKAQLADAPAVQARAARKVFSRLRARTMLVAAMGAASFAPAAHAQYRGEISSIILDANTGTVLQQDNADLERFPASLTKLMTLYMTFEALRDRRITFDTAVPVSDHAASMEPSKLGLLPGSYITVQEAVLGLVTKSANDAASALGELLGGDEDRFGQMMTLRARALGMSHTTFRNASGLPNPDQMTTASDLALLTRHLISDFPEQYHYFATPYFWFHGRMIPNHDPMLKVYPGADGLKTGYTDAAGCNLVTSAVRGNVRLIGVVLGARNNVQRSQIMVALLNQGFSQEGVPVPATPVPSFHAPRARFHRGMVLVADTFAAAGAGAIWHGRHHLGHGHHMLRMEAAVTEAVAHGRPHLRAIHATRLLHGGSARHHGVHHMIAQATHAHGARHLYARAGRQHAANTRLADGTRPGIERA